jgi:PAS domain S-box-containing protein
MATELRVLIVEDSADDAELIGFALKEGGYDVVSEVVATEDAYVTALAKGQWDVILCDHNLTLFDSLEALRLLQAQDQDIPFIIVSGAIGEEVAVAAMKAGASDYVMKDRLARLAPAIEREIREAAVRRDRAQAQEALRQSEAWFRALSENSYDTVAVVDSEGVFTYLDSSVQRVLGYAPADLQGTNGFGLVHPEDLEEIQKAFFLLLQTPKGQTEVAFRARHADGSWRWLDLTGTNLMNDPRIAGVVVNFRDISERKQAEEQIAASLRQKEVLLREVHHRVKNNLGVVASLLSLQAGIAEDPVAARALLESQGRVRAMGLVHDKLHMAEDVALVDFGEYLRTFVPSLVQLFYRNGKAVQVEIDADDANLSVDIASPMALIVNELVTNALKYAFPEEGGGRLRITARAPHEKVKPVLIVQDSGAGIPPEALKARSSFGLELVETLAKQVGCRLEIDTRKGTTVSLVQETMP